jgi:DNA polymerase III epsilon subunit-like protein
MRYLSFDLEATGLEDHDYIIEFAMVPFDTKQRTIATDLAQQFYIKCPSFKELKPNLNPWVIENNEDLIKKASHVGVTIDQFRQYFTEYLKSPALVNYFKDEQSSKITLFGKSLNALDFPLLNRDLSRSWMREHFNHQTLDLSSVAIFLADCGKLPIEICKGSGLMKHFHMGEVAHNAMDDAVNTAKIYFKLLDI